MNNIQKTRMKSLELLSWLAIVLITVAAFLGNYYLNISGPVKALIWVGWLVLTLTFGYFTAEGKRVFTFAKESKLEMQKVVWPTRQETIQTTSIVMIMVAITGFVLWGIDSGMMWAIGKITHLG